MMIKKLTKHGNSLALVIDKSLLQILNIEEDTELKIHTDGKQLIISPATEAERKQRVRTSMEKINRKHGEALKKLAE